MAKVVINKCFGKFGLSKAAIIEMRKLGSLPCTTHYPEG